jgi:hypothetical protein
MNEKRNTTKKPENPSPPSNSSAATTSSNKRAARVEAFRKKNVRRRIQRAEMRARLTQGQYLEWRHLCRHIRFYPAKAREEFFSTGRISSHNATPADRSPQRENR